MNIREYCTNPNNCDLNRQIRCILIDREADRLLRELIKSHQCTRFHKGPAQRHIVWQHIAILRDEDLSNSLCQSLNPEDTTNPQFRPNTTSMIKMVGHFIHSRPMVSSFIWDQLSTGIGSYDSASLCKLAEQVIYESNWEFFSLIVEELEKIFDPEYWRLYTWPIIDLIVSMLDRRLHYTACRLINHVHKIFSHPDRVDKLIQSDEMQLRRLIAKAATINNIQFFRAFIRMFWIENLSDPWCRHHTDSTGDRSLPSFSLAVIETSLKQRTSEMFDCYISHLDPTVFLEDNKLQPRFHAALFLLDQLGWDDSIQTLYSRLGYD